MVLPRGRESSSIEGDVTTAHVPRARERKRLHPFHIKPEPGPESLHLFTYHFLPRTFPPEPELSTFRTPDVSTLTRLFATFQGPLAAQKACRVLKLCRKSISPLKNDFATSEIVVHRHPRQSDTHGGIGSIQREGSIAIAIAIAIPISIPIPIPMPIPPHASPQPSTLNSSYHRPAISSSSHRSVRSCCSSTASCSTKSSTMALASRREPGRSGRAA